MDETVGRCLQQYNNTNFFSIYIYTPCICIYIYKLWLANLISILPSWELSHIPRTIAGVFESMVFLFSRVPCALEGIVWVVPSPSNSGKYEGLGQDPRHLNIYVILVVTRYLVPSYSFLTVRRSVATWRKNLFFVGGNCISKVLSVFEVYKWKRMPFFKCRAAT